MYIYGVNLKYVKVGNEGKRYLMRMLNKYRLCIYVNSKGKPAYEEFAQWCEENRYDTNDIEAITKWLDMMDSDGYDMAVILCHIINKIEGIAFSCDNGVIGCKLNTPWDIPESMKNMTKDSFESILSDYTKCITDDEIEFEVTDTDVY